MLTGSGKPAPDWLMECDGKHLIVRSFSMRVPHELEVECRLPGGDWQTVTCKQIGTSSQFDLSEVIPGFVIDVGDTLKQ